MKSLWTGLVGLGVVLGMGCADDPKTPATGNTVSNEQAVGQCRMRVHVPDWDDIREKVKAVKYEVHRLNCSGAVCNSKCMVAKVEEGEGESVPDVLLGPDAGLGPDGGVIDDRGTLHAFADGLFTLRRGDYTVEATPLKVWRSEKCCDYTGADEQSECSKAKTSAPVIVEEQMTTEATLVSNCTGHTNGALDVVTMLNQPPVIKKISISESKFICRGEQATIAIAAEDPNGDLMHYRWVLLDSSKLVEVGPVPDCEDSSTCVFSSTGLAEPQWIKVTVYDSHVSATDSLHSASMTFPIYVQDCVPATCDRGAPSSCNEPPVCVPPTGRSCPSDNTMKTACEKWDNGEDVDLLPSHGYRCDPNSNKPHMWCNGDCYVGNGNGCKVWCKTLDHPHAAGPHS